MVLDKQKRLAPARNEAVINLKKVVVKIKWVVFKINKTMNKKNMGMFNLKRVTH